MAYKPIIIFINIIIILVLLSTFTYSSAPNVNGQDDTFICPNNSSVVCCPLLAHRVASEHHSRCASIILINKSGYNMTLVNVNLEDGRWITSDDHDGTINMNCEPHSILNNESEVISSVTSHFFGGVLGYVTFAMDDDISSKLVINWDVPTVGSPGYMVNFLDESSRNKFKIISKNSFGDTVFQITIYEIVPWTWPKIPPLFFIMFFIAFGGCCCIPFISFISGEMESNHRRQGRQSYAPFEQQEGQHQNIPFIHRGRQQQYEQQEGQHQNIPFRNQGRQQQHEQQYDSIGRHDKRDFF